MNPFTSTSSHQYCCCIWWVTTNVCPYKCVCAHVYFACVYVCVLSGWCPGDLMANTVCFHGPSFRPAAHRNAEHNTYTHILYHTHTHTHMHFAHFNTYGVWVNSVQTHKKPQQPITKASSTPHYAWLLIFTVGHVEMDLCFCLDMFDVYFVLPRLASLTLLLLVFLLSLSDIVLILTQPNKLKLFSALVSFPVTAQF